MSLTGEYDPDGSGIRRIKDTLVAAAIRAKAIALYVNMFVGTACAVVLFVFLPIG